MAKLEGKNINSFEELLAIAGPNFNILEEEIDIEIQKKFIAMSEEIKQRHNFAILQQKYLHDNSPLFDETIADDAKKEILVILSYLPEPSAYRAIELFSKLDTPLKKWAIVSLQQSRILLQSSLLDDPGIFISTGLGGQGSLLRFFIVLLHATPQGLEEYQKNLMKKEIQLAITKAQGIVEEIEYTPAYTTLLLLLPLQIDLPTVLNGIIQECNQYGHFLRNNLLITNVKRIPNEEIEHIIKNTSPKN